MELLESELDFNPRQCQLINSEENKDLTYAKSYSSSTHSIYSQDFTKYNFPINKNFDYSNDSGLPILTTEPKPESYETLKRPTKKIVTSSTYTLKKTKFEGKANDNFLKAVVEDTPIIRSRTNRYPSAYTCYNPKLYDSFQSYGEDTNTQDFINQSPYTILMPKNLVNPNQCTYCPELPNSNNKLQIPLRDYKSFESKDAKSKTISDLKPKSRIPEKAVIKQTSEDPCYDNKPEKLCGKLQIPIRVYQNKIEKDEELEGINQGISKLSISSVEDLKPNNQDKQKLEDKNITNKDVKDYNNENVFKNIEKDLYMFVGNTLGCTNANDLRLDALQKYGIQCSAVEFPVKQLIISGREWADEDIERLKKIERAFQLKFSYAFAATKEKPIILTMNN